MTTKEAMALLAIMKEAYPRFYAGTTKEDTKTTADLWAEMLSDIDFKIAIVVLKRLIATCKFPPTIAEMRESVAAVVYEHVPDAGDAWGEVNSAIRWYGYYREEEALASMREPVRLAVMRMGWRELCASENDIADRAHFLRIYESLEKRTQEKRQLPISLQESIAAIGRNITQENNRPLLSVINSGAS